MRLKMVKYTGQMMRGRDTQRRRKEGNTIFNQTKKKMIYFYKKMIARQVGLLKKSTTTPRMEVFQKEEGEKNGENRICFF
jgi:hypothetical protein